MVVLDGGGSGSVVVFVGFGRDMVLVLVRLGSGELGSEGGECCGGAVDMFGARRWAYGGRVSDALGTDGHVTYRVK